MLAALVAAGFFLSASTCTGPAVKVVDAQPESALVYPGSQVVFGTNEAAGYRSTERRLMVGASAAMPDIVSWYDQQLRQRGWTATGGADQVVAAWQRGYESYALSVDLPLNRVAELRDGRHQTYYLIVYSLSCDSSESPSPSAKLVC